MDNRSKIIEVLSENTDGIKAGDIAKTTGIDKKEVDKELNKLKKEDMLISPKRCFWTVKK